MLCLIDDVDPDSSLGGDKQNFLWMEYAEVRVKPMLREIREPSESMRMAGYTAFQSGGSAADVFKAMIDIALVEET